MFFPKSHCRERILGNDHLYHMKCVLYCQQLMFMVTAAPNQVEWEDAQIWDCFKRTLITDFH